MTDRIPTWVERCKTRLVSDYTIKLLMQEEINDLRAALEQRSRRKQAQRIAELEADNALLIVATRALQTELAKPRTQQADGGRMRGPRWSCAACEYRRVNKIKPEGWR